MLEFLAMNFNLPTVIGAAIVFGGTGWLLWRHHKSGGSCSCGGCSGGCSGRCGGCCSHCASGENH